MARRYYSSTAQRTTLASPLSSGATTMIVAATSGFPGTRPYTLVIDPDTINEEIVTVTAASGTTLTVTRGEDGTTAIAHDLGATVWHGFTGRDLGEPQAHMDSDNAVHGVTGSVVGTTDTQTLSNKSMSGADNTFSDIPQSAVTGLVSDLAAKAPINNPTLTGDVVLPTTTTLGDLSPTEIGYLNGVTSNVQTQLDSKAPIANPTFSGTVSLPSTTSIGGVTSSELSYLAGATANLQGQIDGITGGGVAVPPGGDTNDILVKLSGADYDMAWRPASSLIFIPGTGGNAIVPDGSVTGGDSTGTYSVGSSTYRWHKFTTTGGTQSLINDVEFIGQLLVVGGGGGGGGQLGGAGTGLGGGGGTVWYGDYAFGINANGVDPGVHNATIGLGAAGTAHGGTGTQAGDTRFDDIICYGGGGGMPEAGSPGNGGSGGRSGGTNLGGSLNGGATSSTSTSQGFYCNSGANGGGATAGGAGYSIDIDGVMTAYGAAGGDGNNSIPAASTGSGGGGASTFTNGPGRTGADGIIIVRYRIA